MLTLDWIEQEIKSLNYQLRDAEIRYNFDAEHFDVIFKGRVDSLSYFLRYDVNNIKKEISILENKYITLIVEQLKTLPEMKCLIFSFLN